MPKRTIYVPDDLNKAMGRCKDANWSAIACAAFEVEVQRRKDIKHMGIERNALIERLRVSRDARVSEKHLRGAEAGKKWAGRCSNFAQLKGLAELPATYWDNVQRTIGTSEEDAHGFAGALLAYVDEDAWGARQDQEEFWEQWLGERYPKLDAVMGFVEGAVSVWEEVEEEI